jgi:hypothetical protein
MAVPIASRVAPPGAGVLLVCVAGAAAAVGYLSIDRPSWTAGLVVLGVAGVVVRRFSMAVLLGVAIPFVRDVSGGAVGLEVALSDLLLTAMAAGVLARWVVNCEAPELAALRPLRWVVVPYLAALGVLFVAHPNVDSVVGSLQRVELMVLPLLVGAALTRQEAAPQILGAYVISASAVAVLWMAGVPLGQKNPVGQFVANGLILLVALPKLRRRLWPVIPLLVVGVFWTQSRGAMLSIPVALAVLLLVQRGRFRWRTVALVIPVVAVAYLAFQALPQEAQQRALTFSADGDSKGAWAIRYRELQYDDAWHLIHAHPGLGVGVGSYGEGDGYFKPTINDPHQVLLYEWAQGGYLLLGAFLILMLTPLAVGLAARRSPLGPVAAAVTAAVMLHGLVDIYWVRGTPVLGWLLVGMALAQAHAARAERAEGG